MKRFLSGARRAAQLAAFLVAAPWLAIGWLRCPFGVPYVSCLSCPVSNCPGTWLLPAALTALVASQLVRARSFCGWLCPMGLIQDAAGFLVRHRPSGKPRRLALDRAARWLKYGALVAAVYFVFTLNYPGERAYDYVVRSPRVLDLDALRVAGALGLARYPVRWALLALALAGGMWITRFWCRYLCPFGAALAAGSRLSLTRMAVDAEACRSCSLCERVCPMATQPGSPECISCGNCVSVCPADAVHTKRLGK